MDGEVDIDAGRADIELTHCRGTIRVVNRHGSIRLDVGERPTATQYHLETVSGSVRLFVKEDLLPDLPYPVLALCGSIDDRGPPGAVTPPPNHPRRPRGAGAAPQAA